MNAWLFPIALFLLGLTIWVIGIVFVNKQYLPIFNISSGILAVVCILLLVERQQYALAGVLLCLTLLFAVTNVGLSLSWQKSVASGPLVDLLGKQGMTVTVLQPKGKVRIDDKEFPASSEGLFINEGESVRVIRCSSKILIVEKTSA